MKLALSLLVRYCRQTRTSKITGFFVFRSAWPSSLSWLEEPTCQRQLISATSSEMTAIYHCWTTTRASTTSTVTSTPPPLLFKAIFYSAWGQTSSIRLSGDVCFGPSTLVAFSAPRLWFWMRPILQKRFDRKWFRTRLVKLIFFIA